MLYSSTPLLISVWITNCHGNHMLFMSVVKLIIYLAPCKGIHAMLQLISKNTCILLPSIEYCSAIWDPYHQTVVSKLEMIQHRAARFVLNKPWHRLLLLLLLFLLFLLLGYVIIIAEL